jgi:hypothetical protein
MDAETYKADTGRNNLPKTVNEFNLAYKEAISLWRDSDTPEGYLLAAVLEEHLILES